MIITYDTKEAACLPLLVRVILSKTSPKAEQIAAKPRLARFLGRW
jgi:hypothetical protein